MIGEICWALTFLTAKHGRAGLEVEEHLAMLADLASQGLIQRLVSIVEAGAQQDWRTEVGLWSAL